MGIRGLRHWIQGAAPEAISSPSWSSLYGKRIGVDVLNIMFHIKSHKISLSVYIAAFIAECKAHDITPIFVFDGKPIELKESNIMERRVKRDAAKKKLADMNESDESYYTLEKHSVRVVRNDRCDVKRLCYACGVPFINAKGEADDVLAYLSYKGEIDAVISSDMDMLARGVKILIAPDTLCKDVAYPGDLFGWIQYDLNAILAKVDLTLEQFTIMCVLFGCDYTTGYPYFGQYIAYKLVKKHNNLAIILELLNISNMMPYIIALNQLNCHYTTIDLDHLVYGADLYYKWQDHKIDAEIDTLLLMRCDILRDLPVTQYNMLVKVAA